MSPLSEVRHERNKLGTRGSDLVASSTGLPWASLRDPQDCPIGRGHSHLAERTHPFLPADTGKKGLAAIGPWCCADREHPLPGCSANPPQLEQGLTWEKRTPSARVFRGLQDNTSGQLAFAAVGPDRPRSVLLVVKYVYMYIGSQTKCAGTN